MRVLLFILLIAFILNPAFSQEKKFTTGFEIAVKNSRQIFDEQTEIESDNQNGLSVSATVFYDINSWLQLKSGLNFSYYQLSEKDFSILLPCDSDGSGGVNRFQSFHELDFRLLYLGIPMEARFKLFGETNHLYARAGIELLFNVSSEGSVILHECGTVERELSDPVFSANSFILNSRIGSGYEFKVSNKTKLYFEPFMELWLNKVFDKRPILISEDAVNNSRILAFGLAAGVRF